MPFGAASLSAVTQASGGSFDSDHHITWLNDRVSVCRLDLLDFFKRECEERGATIIYATHIFDGLSPWITHVAYMEGGEMLKGAVVTLCANLPTQLRLCSSCACAP